MSIPFQRSTFMPNYDKLLQASLPEALDNAFESINFVYQTGEQLLKADVTALEELNYTIFEGRYVGFETTERRDPRRYSGSMTTSNAFPTIATS